MLVFGAGWQVRQGGGCPLAFWCADFRWLPFVSIISGTNVHCQSQLANSFRERFQPCCREGFQARRFTLQRWARKTVQMNASEAGFRLIQYFQPGKNFLFARRKIVEQKAAGLHPG